VSAAGAAAGDDGLAELDAMLDARLSALARRAATGDVSFSSPGAPVDPHTEALWRLVEHARGEDDEVVSFDAEAAPEGLLARAGRELSALVADTLRDASQQAVIDTGPGPRLRTRVGWGGDAVTVVGPGASAAEVSAHTAALAGALSSSAHRLRILTMVAVAAGKIAAIIAVPGAAVTALPIAYRCVRDVYEQWRASGAN
jgi:hypothetical protein